MIVPGYHCRMNGMPVARKWPTFRHSVTPILVRRASGWCTCPKIEYLGLVALIASSRAVLPFSSRRARAPRSEEHTSELQSQDQLVCLLFAGKRNDERQAGRF